MSRPFRRPASWLLGLLVIFCASCQRCASSSNHETQPPAAAHTLTETVSPGMPFAQDLGSLDLYAHEAVVLTTGTAGAAAFVLDVDGRARGVWRTPSSETHATRDTRKHYVLAGELIVGTSEQPDVIEAIDPHTGTSLWKSAALPPHVRSSITAFANTGGRVLLALQESSLDGPTRGELISLGKERGELAWRVDAQVAALAGDSSNALVLSPDGSLTLRDGDNGHVRWSVNALEAADVQQVALIAGQALVTQPHGRIVRVDVKTGARTGDVTLAGILPWTITAGADDRTLFALVANMSVPGLWERMLVAIDVASGRERWRGERLMAVHEGSALIGSDADMTYLCTDGSLIAYEAATGKQHWNWGLGRCDSLALWRAAPDKRSVPLVATWWPPGENSLSALPFVPGTPSVQTERFTLDGTVRYGGQPAAGWRVQIGTEVVTTGADGRYHTSGEQRGALVVEPALPHPEDSATPIVLALDGSGHYVVDLDVSHIDPDSEH